MLKSYELMARHFGWDRPPKPASARETSGYLLDRALARAGDRKSEFDLPSGCAEQTGVRGLIEARVSSWRTGAGCAGGRGKVGALGPTPSDGGRAATPLGLVHILSPFDPLIIQRKRTHLFFDYEHRFEAYIPGEKRLFGYFALPVLAGDDIVAALDMRTIAEGRNC